MDGKSIPMEFREKRTSFRIDETYEEIIQLRKFK